MCANPTTVLAAAHAAEADTLLNTALVNGCFDERTVSPLPHHIFDALPITAQEQQSSEVFVLSGTYHPEGTPTAQCVSRLAVARLVPRAEWGQLAAGSAVIYTEAYKFTEDERPLVSHIPALVSHVGTVQVSDSKREVLYTSTWEGNDDQERSHQYGELYEVWEVQRFVAISFAK